MKNGNGLVVNAHAENPHECFDLCRALPVASMRESVCLKVKKLISVLFATIGLMAYSAQVPADLYYVQMEEVSIPRCLLNKIIKEKGAQAVLVESKLYIEVYRNGAKCWRSPVLGLEDAGQRECFSFDQTDRLTSFAVVWKPEDELTVTVNIAESKALVRASTAGAGGTAGALAGAGIGAVGAGMCTGGLGAPAGAVIGAVVGFFGGAGVAQFVPVNGAREVVSFKVSKDVFGLNGVLSQDISSQDDITLSGKAMLKISGHKRVDEVAQGGLKLQSKYLVRVRSLKLSSAQKKLKQGAKYYMEIFIEGEDKPLVLELGQIPADTVTPKEDFLILKNIGGASSVRIRRHRAMSIDPVVFEAKQGATNGTSWVMMGKVQDDIGSFIDFQTFPTE